MTHICSYLAGNALRLPDKALTLCQGKAKTFRTVHSEVAALSQALRTALGVIPGDRIGLITKGTDYCLQAFLAVAACGALAVPINLRWSIVETAAALQSAAAELLIVDADLIQKYHPVLAERRCIVLSVAEGTGVAAFSGSPQSIGRLHYAQDMTREHMGAVLDLQTSDDGAVLVCFTSGTSGPPKGVIISHTALHCQVGSTVVTCVQTARCLSVAMQAMAKLHVVGYREDDVYLHCAPLFHVGGLSSMIAMLAVGAAQVFQPVFAAAETLSLIRRHNVTSLIAVPAMVVSLHEASQADLLMQPQQAPEAVPISRDPSNISSDRHLSRARSSRRKTGRLGTYPSVRVVLLGGGELPARLKGPLQALFPGAHLYTAYGMTEACSSMTFAPLVMRLNAAPSYCSDQADASSAAAADSAAGSGATLEETPHQDANGYGRSGSEAGRHETRSGACAIPVGWPPPGIEMAIAGLSADDSSTRGIFLSNTPAGEIVTRGPHVMLGYWGDPGATLAARLPGGWLCTGDMGQVDAGGCLWFLGRIKDTVRSGGENVSAAAVERVLLQVPGVAAAAVVGLPHDRLGEQVSALLTLDRDVVAWSEDGEAGDAELQQLATGKVAVLSSAAVREACKQRGLSAFMVPRVVHAQHPPLPTNASGKVLKHAVREIMLARIHQSSPASRM